MVQVMGNQEIKIALGQSSLTGPRKQNEDFYGCITPEGDVLRHKGVAVVLADGVGGEKGGREASEYAVKSFLFDYYSTPESWSVQRSMEQVLRSINTWIYNEGRRFREVRHMATTFSGLILKGTRYYIAHVGDSRIYLYRNGELKQLTTDHRWQSRDLPNCLTRGIGLDIHLHLDFETAALNVGDCFVFCTDGITDTLSERQLVDVLQTEPDLQVACEKITARALSEHGQDNATCQVVQIVDLPTEACSEVGIGGRALAFPRRIRSGMVIDDYDIGERLHKGRMGVIHKAKDLLTGRIVAMKFPNPLSEHDDTAVEQFLREEWAGKRLQSPWIVKVIPQAYTRRTYLYYVMDYHEGETLRERLVRTGTLPVSEAVELTIQLCRGLAEMHRLDILHRDIKPENILLTPAHTIKIMDLGTLRVDGFETQSGEGIQTTPGTPTYMAPEFFSGGGGGPQADIFAVGVTLYEFLTGRWPYGEIQPFTTPVYKEWTPPTRWNPDVPPWLETVLAKALDRDPSRRYDVMTALLYDLEHPDRVPSFGSRGALLDRDPVLFWKWGCVVMAAVALTLAITLGVR